MDLNKIHTVKSNATRAAKKAYPDGGYTVQPVGSGFKVVLDAPRTPLPETKWRKLEGADDVPLANGMGLHETFALAYGHFNQTLFGGRLPECIILMHRKKNARGYFWAEQWKNKTTGEGRHEIAMNPNTFGNRTTKEILSTLVHEMTHLEQQAEGKPGKRGYHNAEWGTLMDRVGLAPFDINGERPQLVDGEMTVPKKRTGTKVSHVIVPGGPFELSCDTLTSTGVDITWTTHEPTPVEKALAKQKKASKTKFTCPDCGLNAWAKPDAVLGCWSCGVEMEDAG